MTVHPYKTWFLSGPNMVYFEPPAVGIHILIWVVHNKIHVTCSLHSNLFVSNRILI